MDFKEFKKIYEKKSVEEFNNSSHPNPLVSICVQTYQHENFIVDCLNSILNQQTNFPFEILLGEDNSKDGTRKICLEFSKKFPDKIRFFPHHRENQIRILDEPTSNFNAFYNFFSSRGKYIAFCEGDDIWTDPQKLQKQVKFLEQNPEFVFAYHSYISIDSSGEKVITPDVKYQPIQDLTSQDLLKLNYHPLLLTTCFRNVIQEIPLEMAEVINVDSFLFSLLGEHGSAKYLDDIEPAQYRKHTGGIWSERNNQKKYLSKIITFQKLKDYYNRRSNCELIHIFNKKQKGSMKMLLLSYIKTWDILPALRLSPKLLK